MHFVLKYTIKKHTGGVTDSMGNVMDSKCDKQRGHTIKEIRKEYNMLEWAPTLGILIQGRLNKREGGRIPRDQ